MESTKTYDEFIEACDRFELADEREMELAQQEQHWLHALGSAHADEVRMASQLHAGNSLDSPNMASSNRDELLRACNGRTQAFNDQQVMVGMLAATLERTRADKKRVAEQAAQGSRVDQARPVLHRRQENRPGARSDRTRRGRGQRAGRSQAVCRSALHARGRLRNIEGHSCR